jgi:hypothetical protein
VHFIKFLLHLFNEKHLKKSEIEDLREEKGLGVYTSRIFRLRERSICRNGQKVDIIRATQKRRDWSMDSSFDGLSFRFLRFVAFVKQPLADCTDSFATSRSAVDSKIITAKGNFDRGEFNDCARMKLWPAKVFVH